MKEIIIAVSLISSGLTYAQVGINTLEPKRTLDINGNLRIRDLNYIATDNNYNKVLIADTDGNIDYVNRTEFLPPNTDDQNIDKEVVNNLYTTPATSLVKHAKADPTKIISCGKFLFRFTDVNNNNDTNNPTSPHIEFGLKSPSTEATINTSDPIKIYVSMEQNFYYEGSGFQFYQGITDTSAATIPFEFTSYVNINEEKDITGFKKFATSQITPSEQNVILIQHPEEDALYRLTIYQVNYETNKPSTNQNGTYLSDFAAVCEKF